MTKEQWHLVKSVMNEELKLLIHQEKTMDPKVIYFEIEHQIEAERCTTEHVRR